MALTIVPLSVFAYEGEPAESPIQEEYQQNDDEKFSIIEILLMPLALLATPFYLLFSAVEGVFAAGALSSFFSLAWIAEISSEIGDLIKG